MLECYARRLLGSKSHPHLRSVLGLCVDKPQGPLKASADLNLFEFRRLCCHSRLDFFFCSSPEAVPTLPWLASPWRWPLLPSSEGLAGGSLACPSETKGDCALGTAGSRVPCMSLNCTIESLSRQHVSMPCMQEEPLHSKEQGKSHVHEVELQSLCLISPQNGCWEQAVPCQDEQGFSKACWKLLHSCKLACAQCQALSRRQH